MFLRVSLLSSWSSELALLISGSPCLETIKNDDGLSTGLRCGNRGRQQTITENWASRRDYLARPLFRLSLLPQLAQILNDRNQLQATAVSTYSVIRRWWPPPQQQPNHRRPPPWPNLTNWVASGRQHIQAERRHRLGLCKFFIVVFIYILTS